MTTLTLRRLRLLALRALYCTSRPRPHGGRTAPRHCTSPCCGERPLHTVPRPRTGRDG
ncbi:hypothetical protein OG215_41885 (plasmid) [Streptomyces globisporus]|uniref:hypothetical protein n=1 Tax=Streptomyces globisporus TaxID=1908 RepID=UPI00386C2A07|nr:hypothetical protein OG215_41885 [Streptomyces globisporus]